MSISHRKRTPFIIGFLAPAVILYGGFVILPLLQAFAFSTYHWSGLSTRKTFVGLENFQQLFADPVFWKALRNNMTLLVVGGLFIIALSISVAMAMQSAGKVSRMLRSVYLFPQVMSMVVVAILWMFIFNPSFGLATGTLQALGLKSWVRPWLGDPNTALPAVGIVFVWYATGFYAMLFSAGLKAIPSEVTEAAELDGAEGGKRFWKVTWPLLWATKRTAIVYVIITAVNIFALVKLMTEGGPDRATEVLLTYLYQKGFEDNRFGYATAIAVVNFVLVMLLSAAVLTWFRRDPTEARK